MALTITATVGGATSNSFASESEVIAYMATRLNASSWTTVSGATCTETEKAALIEATRELSALAWRGIRVTETQALSWPRYHVVNPDSPAGLDFDDEVVPQRVKDATAELAFQMVKAGTTDLLAADATGEIISKTVDVLTTVYAAPYHRARGLSRFPSVTRFLRGLLASTPGASLTVERG